MRTNIKNKFDYNQLISNFSKMCFFFIPIPEILKKSEKSKIFVYAEKTKEKIQ